jgi:ribosomal protein S18 acetylase RimI-like enzyme
MYKKTSWIIRTATNADSIQLKELCNHCFGNDYCNGLDQTKYSYGRYEVGKLNSDGENELIFVVLPDKEDSKSDNKFLGFIHVKYRRHGRYDPQESKQYSNGSGSDSASGESKYQEIDESTLYIVGIGVRKECRGKGLGRRLLNGTIKLSKLLHKKYIKLHVRTNNTEARKLYTNVGFLDTQFLHQYYSFHEDGMEMIRMNTI